MAPSPNLNVPHHLCLKTRLVLPFWYQLTRVIQDKVQRATGVCVCSSSNSSSIRPNTVEIGMVVASNHCIL